MILEIIKVKVFYQWEDGKYGVREFDLEVVESTTEKQCEKCFYRINNFHCPNDIPCGKFARKDKKAVYFRRRR